MELSNINSKDIIFALDIGTRSIIGTVGIVKEKKFNVLCECYIEHEERAMMDGQIHDINLVAEGVNTVKKQLEKQLQFQLSNVAIAAAGRFLKTTISKGELRLGYEREIDKEIIRSLELTAVKNAEEEIRAQSEGKLYCVGYSVKNYYLNDYVISNLLSHKGENITVEVIATFLPRSVVESLYAVMDKVGLNVTNLTLEPIAAMEAAVPKSLRLLNLALVDIGAGTSDIAISSKDTISAYGMVATAGDEITEVIAQNFLVDFNTAERMKKECSVKDNIQYTDVLGLDSEVSSKEIMKVINPVVNKLCDEIASKIIELNGGKSPNAVFLVGGGAHTPGLKELLAEKLNLSFQRIAIKGREAVTDCICPDNNLGSTGVTVLGIALTSIMKLGHDFIDVTLNNKVISLFNSHKHTVSDVLMQTGINPKVLIGKNGKNIRFILNGRSRIAFGSLGTNAEIKINGKPGNMDSEVKEGDSIDIVFAKDGMDAAPKVKEFIKNLNSVSFYLDDIITYIEPVVYINNERVSLEKVICDSDEVKILFPNTIKEFRDYLGNETGKNIYFINGKELEEDYIIKEGDRIYTKINTSIENSESYSFKSIEEKKEENFQEEAIEAITINEDISKDLKIFVNGEKVYLKNKSKYIFIDVFDFIDFDLTKAKGNLVLLLNGNKAGYYDELLNGDDIKIYWE
ncbi:rod shape-determining protein [Clostridium sp. SYSU_GA19001]|uniref:cell division protein FtsA n=1 Tax=Clostridium caldaquaticum TaxID=2940653 RepID=UPI0020779534|nr:cell division FtsA domain-containing protein [Clostridium caldaquaticum]MCM8711328.1 rod shape-determining protein [Clostridium caldaquaticum]